MGSSPYGFEITQNCLICKLREAGFFCDLPNLDCRIGSESSTPEVAHRALYCLWKGSPRAASTSFARAGSSCPPPHHLTRRQDPDPAHCPGGKVLGLDATVPVNSTNSRRRHSSRVLDFIKREDFLCFLQNHGEELPERLRDDRFAGPVSLAWERLARWLLAWSSDGEPTKDAIRIIKVSLTHEEMAQLIGTSRQTVTRVLGEFRDKQLAQLRCSTLLIKNRAGLEKPAPA